MQKPGKTESVRRKPRVLERYVDLMYRKKVRSKLVILRLNKLLTAEELRMLMQEERNSALTRSITFFLIGFVLAYALLQIFHVGTAWADEPPKRRAFMIGDSQAFLLMHDMPRLAPPGWEIKSAVAPGSSVISWSRDDHGTQWSELRRAKPDALLIVLGTNDVYMGPRIIKNEYPFLMRLMNKFERVTKNIFWIGPPRLERRLQGVEHFQTMLSGMDGLRLKYMDSTVLDLKFWGDRMHCARPSPEGCEQWARWIWSNILLSNGRAL